MKRWLAMAVIVGAFWPAAAMAQPTRGDWELTLSGSGANSRDFNGGAFGLTGSLGYFFTDQFELSLRQSVNLAQSEGTTWAGVTRVAADYHFDFKRLQPFVGVNVGYVYGSPTQDTWEAAPEVGLKWFVKDKTFIFGMVEYEFFFGGNDSNGGFSQGQFVYTIGIGFNF